MTSAKVDDQLDEQPTLPPVTAHVVLLSHSLTSNNLGVVALTLSNIALMDGIAASLNVALDYTIIGSSGRVEADTSCTASFQVLSFRELVLSVCGKRSAIRATLDRCDLVVDIGEGDSFADIYGLKRFATLALSKILTLRTRTPLVLAPQTVGPFKRQISRLVAHHIIERCEATFVRDGLSLKYVRGIAPRATVYETTDVAFILPYVPAPTDESCAIRVGVNISGLLMGRDDAVGPRLAAQECYPAFIHSLLDRLCADDRYEVHLIPHVLGLPDEHDEDVRWCTELQKRYPSSTVPGEFSSPSAAKSYIATMDFFTGARMHACIAALSAGVPSVPIAYTRKAVGLFGSLGYDSVVDFRSASPSAAVAVVLAGLERRDELKSASLAAAQEASTRLDIYRREFSRILASVCG